MLFRSHEALVLMENLLRGPQILNPAPYVNCAVSNVICSMIMSTRFQPDSLEFQRFMHNFDEGFRLFVDTGAMMYLPILKLMPGVASTLKKLRSNRQEMLSFVKKIINQHREKLDPSNPRDLVDSYLITIEKLRSDNSNNNNQHHNIFHGYDPELQLEQILLDLFSAGVETLKTSMLWAILYMLHNEPVMKRVQAELDEKVGTHRLPKVQDLSQLVYTKATLYEIMRRSSVVPMGTTHATERYIQALLLIVCYWIVSNITSISF